MEGKIGQGIIEGRKIERPIQAEVCVRAKRKIKGFSLPCHLLKLHHVKQETYDLNRCRVRNPQLFLLKTNAEEVPDLVITTYKKRDPLTLASI